MPKDKQSLASQGPGKTEKKKMMVVEEVEDKVPAADVADTPKEEVVTDEKIIEDTPKVHDEHDHVHDHHHNEEEKHEHPEHVAEEPQVKDEEVELEYSEKSQGLMWIIVLTALLVGALAGGFITYFSGLSRLDAPAATPTPMAAATPASPDGEPTPASQSELKREDVKVQILNGSGVSGAAGKAKAALEKLGYKDVQTGNSPTSDVAETEISILKAKENYLDLVKKDLEDSDYTVAKSTKTLPTSSKFDVVITLGKK
jgi:hypothetical protein